MLFACFGCYCCCCYPTPSEGLGAWRKTIESHKAGNSPGLGPEVIERQKVTKSERRRVRSWTVQNEMESVQGRMSTGAARRLLDSANPREIELNGRLCPLQRKQERAQRA